MTSIGPWAATAARLLLGVVLVVAGALKLPDPAAAVRAVRAYRLLPEVLVGPVAFGLPVLEIAVGLALLAGLFVRTAAIAAAVLMVVFLAAVRTNTPASSARPTAISRTGTPQAPGPPRASGSSR